MAQRLVVQDAPRRARRLRTPKHTFVVAQRPFLLQPFLIAPVLPGETLRNLLLQSRVVTDPIANPIIGWWKEYWFFYVKLRDMENRATYESMLLDQGFDVSALYSASNTAMYHRGSKLNYVQECLKRVVECYFRDEGEAWDVAAGTIDSMPVVKLNQEGWWNSLIDATTLSTETLVDEAGAGTLTVQELEEIKRRAIFDQMMDWSNMDFNEYLRMAGVRIAKEEAHIPELIRYVRQWSYPTNTIDPADGSAASAVSWAIQERADKDRFIKEPGFIFGVTTTRPKTYHKDLLGHGASMMDTAFSWMPAVLRDDPRTSLLSVDNATGPAANLTNDYYVDVRDLLLYGDQFVGGTYAPASSSGINLTDTPTTAGSFAYPATTDIDSLFAVGTSDLVREDGAVRLAIATPEGIDFTPRTIESGNLTP